MSVLLHATTQLPLPTQPVSAGRSRSIELWLLTAFLFSLLIIGRLTAHNSAGAQLNSLPAGTTLLHRMAPPITPNKPANPAPFFQPTAFYLPALTTTIQ